MSSDHQMEYTQVSPKLKVNYERLLGKGSTGNVYQGLHISKDDLSQISAAVKIIPLSEINNPVVSYLLQCELQGLKIISNYCASKTQHNQKSMQNQSLHLNKYGIVELYEIIVIEGNCYIVMQLLQGGTLKEYIQQQKKINQEKSIELLKKLLIAYNVINLNGIVHRDLKPDNIIFTQAPSESSELIPKIIDFGYCQVRGIKKPDMFYNVGSPRYMSPEAYLSNTYSEKSDIWALGIIFYEMVTGTNFDKGKQIKDCFKQIKQMGIPIPSTLGVKSRKFLQMMLMYDPKKRKSSQEMLFILESSNQQLTSQLKQTKKPQQGQSQNPFTAQKNAFIRHSMGPFPNHNRNTMAYDKNQIKSHDRANINPSPEENRLVRSNVINNPRTPSARIQQSNINAPLNSFQPKNAKPAITDLTSSNHLSFMHRNQLPIRDLKRDIMTQSQKYGIPMRQSMGNQILLNSNHFPNNNSNKSNNKTTLTPSASEGNIMKNPNNNIHSEKSARTNPKLIHNIENEGNFQQLSHIEKINNNLIQSNMPQEVHKSPNKYGVNFIRDRITTIPQNQQNMPGIRQDLSDRDCKIILNSVQFRKQDLRHGINFHMGGNQQQIKPGQQMQQGQQQAQQGHPVQQMQQKSQAQLSQIKPNQPLHIQHQSQPQQSQPQQSQPQQQSQQQPQLSVTNWQQHNLHSTTIPPQFYSQNISINNMIRIGPHHNNNTQQNQHKPEIHFSHINPQMAHD